MPTKTNRNNAQQQRQSVSTETSPQVNPYHSPNLFEFDSPSPALAVNDLPTLDTPASPDPLPVPLPDPRRRILAAERDLMDMHGSPPVVREDRPMKNNISLPESLPPPVSFDLTKEQEARSPTSLGIGVRYQDNREVGHVRSPVLAREPTMLESFSRTVRSYVPSSIPIPTGAPAPTRVSRTISTGSFMPPSPSLLSTSPGLYNRRSSSGASGSSAATRDWRASGVEAGGLDAVFGSDDEEGGATLRSPGIGRTSSSTSYPGVNDGDVIVWSRWDDLREKGAIPRRFLFLGYSVGFQVWDCTHLGAVSEILNLSSVDSGTVLFSGVLPRASLGRGDEFADHHPLIGIITRRHGESKFLVYSLRSHQVLKSIGIHGSTSFIANERFIVIATTNTPSLHIISTQSFITLHIIASTSLVPFVPPGPTPASNSNKYKINNVLVPYLDGTPDSDRHLAPIYSLSHRLLAFASAPAGPDSSSPTGIASPAAQPRSRPTSGGFGGSQAELALKVGGSVLSGMKTLGGMAYSAAKSRVAPSPPPASQVDVRSSSTPRGLGGMFFSRSAPAASGGRHEQGTSFTMATGDNPSPVDLPLDVSVASNETQHSKSPSGYHITVLDLAPLSGLSTQPTLVTEFVALKRQHIVGIEFTGDGNSLVVSPEDGRVIRVFQIRPSLSVPRAIVEHEQDNPPSEPWHTYNLRRGRTHAVVEGVSMSQDGRWAAVGSRKRTVHIFAVNPYGGKADRKSHLDGRVRNVPELQPLSTEVAPIVRLRPLKSPAPDRPSAPLSFTFVESSNSILPANLLPPATVAPSSPTSVHSSPALRPEPLSPRRAQRPVNYQDILLFDPTDGSLSLWRLILELRSLDHVLSLPSVRHGTSASLPGTSAAGRLSTPPSSSGGRPSGLSRMMEAPMEVIAKEGLVASWNVKRKHDWGEIRQPVYLQKLNNPSIRSRRPNTLSQAEISTSSRSNRILPRSIYLSHQFSFYAFSEDYHALIRRFHLDIEGTKIEVRKEVTISAYSTGTGESFVEGLPAPREFHRASSSFDEPLASALSAGLDYSHPSPAIIPMLPNGTPHSKPRSFRNPAPIRHVASGLSDGVSEGLGRIRREMHKVRSPQPGPRSDVSSSVTLEFNEEDEDFPNRNDRLHIHEDDSMSRSTSRGEGDSGASVSTPSTSAVHFDEDPDDSWHGWNAEDKLALDEAEQFDDVVGFLDEDQTPKIHAQRTERSRRRAV